MNVDIFVLALIFQSILFTMLSSTCRYFANSSKRACCPGSTHKLLPLYIYAGFLTVLHVGDIGYLIFIAVITADKCAAMCALGVTICIASFGISVKLLTRAHKQLSESDSTVSFNSTASESLIVVSTVSDNPTLSFADRQTMLTINSFRAPDEEMRYCCRICHSRIKRGSIGIMLHCRHTFDQQCMEKWLLSSSACPVCREDLTTSIYQRTKKLSL